MINGSRYSKLDVQEFAGARVGELAGSGGRCTSVCFHVPANIVAGLVAGLYSGNSFLLELSSNQPFAFRCSIEDA
jgi:hypothetical protein